MGDCSNCNGGGKIVCPNCKGSGYEPSESDGWIDAAADVVHNVVCGPDECEYEGCEDGEIDCPECGGSGEIED